MQRWLALVVLAGCYNPTIAPGAPCQTSRDCPGSQVCIANTCDGTEPMDAAIVIDSPADAPTDAGADVLDLVDVVLGDDIAEIRDTEIWEATPTTPHGSDDHFSIDSAELGLLWFDLTAITDDKTVMSATLTVTVADAADEAGGTATLHRLREAWVEAEATWNMRTSAQAWSVVGAGVPARDVTAVATFTPAAINTAYDIVLPPALVQAWIDNPAINFGVLFARGTSTEHVHIRSRETATPPRLTVSVY